MDFENMTQQEKIEYIGYIEANRLGDPVWVDQNSFYESNDGKVSVTLDNDEEEQDEEF